MASLRPGPAGASAPDDLFGGLAPPQPVIAPGAMLLSAYALPWQQALLEQLAHIILAAPWRHMLTPGGQRIAVANSNCGALGWISDRKGYRYSAVDPLSGQPWPALPAAWLQLAREAAASAGYADFVPDACLINRYQPGTRLSLHQDKNEQDFHQPIVSISLGLPATFQFGGLQRSDPSVRIPLQHGDVVVWGGPSRLRFHGVMPLRPGRHALLGEQRINLTLRRAG